MALQKEQGLAAAERAGRSGDRINFDAPREGVRELGAQSLREAQGAALDALSRCAFGASANASIDSSNLSEYVRASLGLSFKKREVARDFSRYADQLSRNASTWALWKQPVTGSSAMLAIALFVHVEGRRAFDEATGKLDVPGCRMFIAKHTGLSVAEVSRAIKESYFAEAKLEIGTAGPIIRFLNKPPLTQALTRLHIKKDNFIGELRSELAKEVESAVSEMAGTSPKTDRRAGAVAASAFTAPGQRQSSPASRAFAEMRRIAAHALGQLPGSMNRDAFTSVELRRAIYGAADTEELPLFLKGFSGPQLETLAASHPSGDIHPSDVGHQEKQAVMDQALVASAAHFMNRLSDRIKQSKGAYEKGQRALSTDLADMFAREEDGDHELMWMRTAARASLADPGTARACIDSASGLCGAIDGNRELFSAEILERLSTLLRALAPLGSASERLPGGERVRLAPVLTRLNLRRREICETHVGKGCVVGGARVITTAEAGKDELGFDRCVETITHSRRGQERPVPLSVRLKGMSEDRSVSLPASFFRDIGAVVAKCSFRMGNTNVAEFVGQQHGQDELRFAKRVAHLLANYCETGAELHSAAALLRQATAVAVDRHYREMVASRYLAGEDGERADYRLADADAGGSGHFHLYRHEDGSLRLDVSSINRNISRAEPVSRRVTGAHATAVDSGHSDYSATGSFEIGKHTGIVTYASLAHETVLVLKAEAIQPTSARQAERSSFQLSASSRRGKSQAKKSAHGF